MSITFYRSREELYKAYIPAMVGVEIGVQEGRNARSLLDAGALELGLIDPWKHFDEGEYTKDPANIPQRDMDWLFGAVLEKFKAETQSGRVHIHRLASLQAAPLFGEGSLDFAMIDGDHSYAAVYADLLAWENAISEKGIFLLHDHCHNSKTEAMGFDVPGALARFMDERKWRYVAHTLDEWPTVVVQRR